MVHGALITFILDGPTKYVTGWWWCYNVGRFIILLAYRNDLFFIFWIDSVEDRLFEIAMLVTDFQQHHIITTIANRTDNMILWKLIFMQLVSLEYFHCFFTLLASFYAYFLQYKLLDIVYSSYKYILDINAYFIPYTLYHKDCWDFVIASLHAWIIFGAFFKFLKL